MSSSSLLTYSMVRQDHIKRKGIIVTFQEHIKFAIITDTNGSHGNSVNCVSSTMHIMFICNYIFQFRNNYLQEGFVIFGVVFLHLQQPAVAPLPEKSAGIGILCSLAATHIHFDIGGVNWTAELYKPKGWKFIRQAMLAAIAPKVISPASKFSPLIPLDQHVFHHNYHFKFTRLLMSPYISFAKNSSQ